MASYIPNKFYGKVVDNLTFEIVDNPDFTIYNMLVIPINENGDLLFNTKSSNPQALMSNYASLRASGSINVENLYTFGYEWVEATDKIVKYTLFYDDTNRKEINESFKNNLETALYNSPIEVEGNEILIYIPKNDSDPIIYEEELIALYESILSFLFEIAISGKKTKITFGVIDYIDTVSDYSQLNEFLEKRLYEDFILMEKPQTPKTGIEKPKKEEKISDTKIKKIKIKISTAKANNRNFWSIKIKLDSERKLILENKFNEGWSFEYYHLTNGIRDISEQLLFKVEVGDIVIGYVLEHKQRINAIFEVISKESEENDQSFKLEVKFRFRNRIYLEELKGSNDLIQQSNIVQKKDERFQKITYEDFKEILNFSELAPLEENNVDEKVESKNEYIKWFFDDPTNEDKLFRDHIARTFVKQMHSIWPYYDPTIKKRKERRLQKSFMVHIQGPWGSGKSSFLNFIVNHLKKLNVNKKDKKNKWKIVQFNAWKNQHVSEPWWILLNTIYQQTICPKWWNIFNWKAWKERFRRLKTGNKYYLIFAILILILTILGISYGIPYLNRNNEPGPNDSNNLQIVLGVFTAVFGLIASIFAISKNLNDSLASASDTSATNFLKHAKDPMKRIKIHFEKLIRDIDRPVAILIDDLDRCHPEFVVKFMEGIQTLFRNGNILYIITADRKWISSCFEIEYEKFSEKMETPGTRLGYLFVQKAFQLSIRMPVMTNSVKERFWKYLLDVKDKEDITAKEKEIAEEFKGLKTEEAIEEQINTLLKEQKGIEPIIRAQAVETLSDNVSLKETEHILQDYHHYLEPNPRSIKRLASYYPLATSNRILEGMDIERSILVRWIEISHRWPVLHEAIEKNPELIKYYTSKTKFKDKIEKDILQLFEDSTDLKNLIEGKKFDGNRVDPKFTVDDVRKCLGIYEKQLDKKEIDKK